MDIMNKMDYNTCSFYIISQSVSKHVLLQRWT